MCIRDRGLLLRRLPALRRHRPVLSGDGRGDRCGHRWATGARHLQRVSGALRVPPAARGAGAQRRAALRLPGPGARRRVQPHGLDLGVRRRRSHRRTAQERRGPLRRRRPHLGRARGRGTGGVSVRRGQPQRLAAGHRRHRERGRHRGRPDAAPRARGRGPDRAGGRGARRLRQRALEPAGRGVTPDTVTLDTVTLDTVTLDTVTLDAVTLAAGASAADSAQPYAELGLRADEYARIREILGRRPTATELAMYAVMWSEHCSYKSSKVHLRQFAATAPDTGVLLVGMGENAGVVDVGEGLAVTFKVESHNHPSYVEPYQGAATGVGGIELVVESSRTVWT